MNELSTGVLDGVDVSAFRRTMSRFPTFVTVITAATPDGPVGCTATAVLSLSLEPPTMVVSLRTAGHTLADILRAGMFGVNALAWQQRELIRRFATGRPDRRFDGVPYTVWDDVPVLDGASATVVCRLRETVSLLDHTLLVGTVARTGTGATDPLVLLDGESQVAVASAAWSEGGAR
ncbi:MULTISPECIES: flavin reductase family protein [unclassified Micromonospora]|uniref:flavin reductase family protein n=1 Tax=unclassified Micromonospora TaxID=2617518 RepID=UPI00362E81F0